MKPRILVVEDNRLRCETFQSWLPPSVVPLWARSAGVALGIIQRDTGHAFAGVLLDHDLNEQAITTADLNISGTQVAAAIVQNFSRDVAVLVHSTNHTPARRVATRLEKAGFWVTRLPMSRMTQNSLNDWIDEVVDLWELRSD